MTRFVAIPYHDIQAGNTDGFRWGSRSRSWHEATVSRSKDRNPACRIEPF